MPREQLLNANIQLKNLNQEQNTANNLQNYPNSNTIDQIEFNQSKHLNKTYRLQLTEVTYQGKACLGVSFIDQQELKDHQKEVSIN